MNKCLGQDPGGKRMGWAIVANPHDRFDPVYVDSGVMGLIRHVEGKNQEPYQEYKLRLVEYFAMKAEVLFRDHRPVAFANEIQPAVGGGNYTAATQAELAKTSMVVFQAAAFREAVTVKQFGSNTIKKAVTGDQKASKVKVRNAVIEYFPQLADRKRAWQTGPDKEGFDEPDAIAAALTYWLTKKYL